MNLNKITLLIVCCVLFSFSACTKGVDMDYDSLYPECEITVRNESDLAIMAIYLVESSSPQWSENLLTTSLLSGQSVTFVRAKGVYKMRLVQESDIISEVPLIDVVELEELNIVVE